MKMTSLVVALFLSTSLLPAPGWGARGWQAETPLLTARDQFSGGVVDGKIYVFGGNGNPDSKLKSIEMFDPATRQWTYQTPNSKSAEELTGAVVTVLDQNLQHLFDKLYIFGAWGGGTPYGVFNFVEEFFPTGSAWTSKASMPTSRASTTAVVYNGEIYVFGGYYASAGGEQTRYDLVEAYNPATDTWRFVTHMPKVLMSPAIAVVGNLAYVISGASVSEGNLVSDVITYNFSSGTWTNTGYAPIPNPRVSTYSSAAPVVNGKIYLTGGIMGTPTAPVLSDNVDIYDTTANTWSRGPALPKPLHGHLAVVLDNSLYVIGGTVAIAPADLRTNEVWTIKLPFSANISPASSLLLD